MYIAGYVTHTRASCIMRNVHKLVLESLYVLVGVPRRDRMCTHSRRDNHDMRSRNPMLIHSRNRA